MGSSLAESERTCAVPRVSAARTRQQGLEKLEIRSNRVFQQYRPKADIPRQLRDVCFGMKSRHITAMARGDVFFHQTSVVGGVMPPIDSVVEYVEEIGKDGRLRSTKLRTI